MKKPYLLSLILLLLLLSSCRVRYVAMPEVHQRDSLRVSNTHRYDSIFTDRWHFLFQRGDTVFKTDSVYVEKIHEVEVHDTVTNTTRDSVPYPVEVPIEVPTPVPRFYRNCTIGFWLIILGFVLYWAIRIAKALYLHR